MMEVFYDFGANFSKKNVILTLGMFDGVHLAHRQIISECVLRAKATGKKSVFLTYEPHPQQVIAQCSAAPFKLLTTIDEKLEMVEALGIDMSVVLTFTRELAAMTAEDFLQNIRDFLLPSEIVVGYRTTFGKNREGNAETLQAFSTDHNIEFSLIAPIFSKEIVSSSSIRSALCAGDIKSANTMLGRAYAITGQVTDGDKRGRTLGFKTANIVPKSADKLVPADGVYACDVTVLGKVHRAVVNIGARPTFERGFSIEAHILDFSHDIYSENITLHFLNRLRGVKRFAGENALIAAINSDIETTRELNEKRQKGIDNKAFTCYNYKAT